MRFGMVKGYFRLKKISISISAVLVMRFGVITEVEGLCRFMYTTEVHNVEVKSKPDNMQPKYYVFDCINL